MSGFKTGMSARIGIQATLVVRRANGETKEVHLNQEIPLAQLGITEDQARDLVQQSQVENEDERHESM